MPYKGNSILLIEDELGAPSGRHLLLFKYARI